MSTAHAAGARPHRGSGRGATSGGLGTYLIIVGCLFFALAPLYWMASSALKSGVELGSSPPTLYPHHLTLEQFRAVINGSTILSSLLTSAVIAVVTTVIVVCFGSAAAYAVTHWPFRGSRHFLIATLFTQLLPQTAVLVPVYLLWSRLGLAGSAIGATLAYIALLMPVAVWMLVGYFRSIPIELTEAGLVDGAGRLRVLCSIILPLATPGIAAAAIYTALACWSEFLFALVLLSNGSSTVTVSLAGLIGQHNTDLGQLMAASTFATVPPLLVFSVLQRYFVSGLTMGSVKS